jgi:hypothetical protein
MKRGTVSGGILTFVGYMLSPLSWWNDLFVNVPLALVGAWIVSLFSKTAFEAAFVLSYWITNIIGFFLMHKGVCRIFNHDCSNRTYVKNGLAKDLLAGLGYTLLIIVLVRLNILQPIQYYLEK